jgi:hypothetical protein
MRNIKSSGPGFGMTTQKPAQNKPGELCVWKQRSFLTGIYSHTRRNQTEQEEAEGNQGRKTAN